MSRANETVRVADFATIFNDIEMISRFGFSEKFVDNRWGATTGQALAEQFFQFYQQSDRTYHGVAHPYNMFACFLELAGQFRIMQNEPYNATALGWMIVGHDIIIKFGELPGWNETESARLTGNILRELGYPKEFIAFVERGIRATATHSLDGIPKSERSTIALLLDLDLMGLGQSPASFTADTESIWLEYQPHITRGAYDAGRKEWAAKFLERPRIYHTAYFADKEDQAIANLKALVEQ